MKHLKINERSVEVTDSETLLSLKKRIKPNADIVILNGAPMRQDRNLTDGDGVVFIKRGEIPLPDELEALMVSRHTPGVHEKVKKAVVGIAGLGGLGSNVANALTRVGVGRLILADFDVVEPSNLNRQQYFIDQIGLKKTEALSANLRRINPYVTLETHCILLSAENVPTLFKEVDVLIEAFDTPPAKAMIAESFCTAFPDKPLVMASGMAGFFSNNTIQTRKMGRSLYVAGDLVNEAQPGCGLMAPRVGIAAHHQANQALRLILGLSDLD